MQAEPLLPGGDVNCYELKGPLETLWVPGGPPGLGRSFETLEVL